MVRVGLSRVEALLIILLIVSNLCTYLMMYSENCWLRDELEYAWSYLIEIGERAKRLEEESRMVNASYRRVLESNRRLEDALRYLHGKLIVPYNFTLMTIDEFYDRFAFKYTGDMVEFVSNATGWWDGSGEDLLSDLYRIYRSWREYYIVDENSTTPREWLPYINIGKWNYEETFTGDTYLKEILLYENNPTLIPIDYAALHFKHHRGACYSYAFVLTTLYYIYADVTGVDISAAYLSITIDGRLPHACVLLKDRDGLIAIVDWEAVTAENGKIKFVPIDTATTLHGRYWRKYWLGYKIDYNSVWMRPNIIRRFSSYEEFKEWLIEGSR